MRPAAAWVKKTYGRRGSPLTSLLRHFSPCIADFRMFESGSCWQDFRWSGGKIFGWWETRFAKNVQSLLKSRLKSGKSLGFSHCLPTGEEDLYKMNSKMNSKMWLLVDICWGFGKFGVAEHVCEACSTTDRFNNMSAERAKNGIPSSGGDFKVGIWMPLYVGDYLADTIDLNNREHGSYLRCMMKYWTKGEALTEREISQICGRDVLRIKEYFVWCDERWHHKRIDAELRVAWNRKQEAREKAMKMVEARRRLGQLPPKGT